MISPVLLMLLLIGKSSSDETWSGRYVKMTKSASIYKLSLCALNDNIMTCGAFSWPYWSSFANYTHFHVYSINKDSGTQGKHKMSSI